ncbi:hypothetical protein GCM10023310_00900 [Paenibacillus vulneris]|uniref:Uncharacterized protein n=1 Tax=Paenibacillus vulneris TaxID=1133364 RepID=A0ABW3UYW0_9BACL
MSIKEKNNETAAPEYTKQQFLESSVFTAQQKDVLHALLLNGETYTIEQVTQKVKEFAGKVAN